MRESAMSREVAAQDCVLIVDDDAALCEALAEYVENLGIACLVEHDGRAGLNRLEDSQPAVAIVDIQMPAVNGFEVVRLARERYPDLRLVLMSGAKPVELSAATGFDDKYLILQKPLPLDELATFLKRSFGRE